MQTQVHKIHRLSFLGTLSCALALTFVLAACGTNTTTSGSSGSAPVPAATSSQAAAHGCPNTTLVSSPPPAAKVTLGTNTPNSTTANAQKGDTIQINLPFGNNWSGPTASPSLLAMQNPAGYDSSTDKACVWRFVATAAGSTQVSFTARPICKKGEACPMFIRVVAFTIHIT